MDFHDLEAAAARNPALASRFRFSRLCIVLRNGARDWTLTIRDGQYSVADGSASDADFTLEASDADWAAFVSERPPVGYQTLFAMATIDRLKLSGPRMDQFSRYQMGLEMLLQGLRPLPPQLPRLALGE